MAMLDGRDVAEIADPTVGVPAEGELQAEGELLLDQEIAEEEPETAERAEQASNAAGIQAGPAVPPIIVVTRPVYGRYRSAGTSWQLELRVDVDGTRPLKRVSGDFFQVTGATTKYFGSFQVDAPTITKTTSEIKLEGTGSFTWATTAKLVRVTIPRVKTPSVLQPATVKFITPPSTAGATYACPFVSRHFRTITFEQDSVAGTVPFVSYDTGSLPQPANSPARTLTVSSAYGEAGVELLVGGTPNVVPVSAAGPGAAATWSDSELHAAMVNHFSKFSNSPRWQVWLLVATTHEGGYRGIMFDASDAFQRQGAAVFYDAIKGNDANSQRAQLRTYVHEIGHAFNLLHSWQKNLADPPQPLGPNGGLGDLSWMNYAWKYQPPAPDVGGEAAYWSKFAFQFTDRELAHLRHGLYKNVIMGANAFAKGAAEVDPDLFDDPISDASGLALELRSKGTFEYGEPVVVELKLATTDLRGSATHTYLHPKDDFVTIAIRQPSGRTVVYRPLMPRCADEGPTVILDADKPAVYDSAFIGYGRDGLYFEAPGEYALRAQYIASDGSRVVSPVLRLRVRSPLSRADEHVGELLMGPEQGQLLYLLGSDADSLQTGNEAFDELLDAHGEHPLAVYPQMLKGVNAGRDFKQLTSTKELEIRSAKPEETVELLSKVVDASRPAPAEGVDDITLNLVMRRLARAQARAGDLAQADAVLDDMISLFESRNFKPHVLAAIREQAQRTKAAITEAAQ
jgi:hypothetical protein